MNYRLSLIFTILMGLCVPMISPAMEQGNPFMCKVPRDKEEVNTQNEKNHVLEELLGTQKQEKEACYQFTCATALKAEGFLSIGGRSLAVGTSDAEGSLLVAAASVVDVGDNHKTNLSLIDIRNKHWKNIACGSLFYGLEMHNEIVCAGMLPVNPHPDYLRRIVVWDRKTDSLKKLRGRESRPLAVEKDATGRDVVLLAEEDNAVFVLKDIETGDEIQRMMNTEGYDSATLRRMHDGRLMVVASGHFALKIFEIGTNEETIVQKNYKKRRCISEIILYEDKNYKPTMIEVLVEPLVGGTLYNVCIRDVATGKVKYMLPHSGKSSICDIAYEKIKGRNVLVIGAEDGCIHLWDLDCDKPKRLNSFKAHDSGFMHVAVRNTPSGYPQIVSGQKDVIKVWDCVQQQEYFKKAQEALNETTDFPQDLITTIMGYAGSEEDLQQKIEPAAVVDEDEKQAAELLQVSVNHSTIHEGSLQEIPIDNPIPSVNHNEIGQARIFNEDSWFSRNKKLMLVCAAIVAVNGLIWLWTRPLRQ